MGKSAKQTAAVAAVAFGLLFGMAAPALAATVHTTNGYAYNSGLKKVYVKDTATDGHEVEAQVYLEGSGTRYTTRAGDGAGDVSSRTFSTNMDKFRVCRLMIIDQCSAYYTF